MKNLKIALILAVIPIIVFGLSAITSLIFLMTITEKLIVLGISIYVISIIYFLKKAINE